MYTFIISHNGEVKKRFENQESDMQAFGYLLRAQGNSTDYALRYGGWKVEQINQDTKESEFWKPYSSDLMMFKSESEKRNYKSKS